MSRRESNPEYDSWSPAQRGETRAVPMTTEEPMTAASLDDGSGSQDGLDYHPDIVCENCGADSHADDGWRHDCATTQGQPPVTGVDWHQKLELCIEREGTTDWVNGEERCSDCGRIVDHNRIPARLTSTVVPDDKDEQ